MISLLFALCTAVSAVEWDAPTPYDPVWLASVQMYPPAATINETRFWSWGWVYDSDVEFRLFTRRNPYVYQVLKTNDSNALRDSNFDFSKKVKVLAHGWLNHGDGPMPESIKEGQYSLDLDYIRGGDTGTVTAGAVQVNPRTGSRLKAEVRCDGAPLTPASPRFARHNHNHLGGTTTNIAAPNTCSAGGAIGNAAGGEAVCAGACSRCSCCGCTLREAAARHEQRVAANERLERANIEWKQVAVVADRALLAVFVLVTAVSTAAILLPQLNNLHVGNTPLKPPI